MCPEKNCAKKNGFQKKRHFRQSSGHLVPKSDSRFRPRKKTCSVTRNQGWFSSRFWGTDHFDPRTARGHFAARPRHQWSIEVPRFRTPPRIPARTLRIVVLAPYFAKSWSFSDPCPDRSISVDSDPSDQTALRFPNNFWKNFSARDCFSVCFCAFGFESLISKTIP